MTDNSQPQNVASNTDAPKVVSSTEALVEELHDVAEGLKDVVEEVEIIPQKAESHTVSQAEQSLEKPSEVAPENTKDQVLEVGNKPEVEVQASTEVRTDSTNSINSQTSKQTVVDSKKDVGEVTNQLQPVQPMVEKKASFNPFGFLKKKTQDKESIILKRKRVPKLVKALVLFVITLIAVAGITGGVGYLLVKPVVENGQKSMTLASEAYQLLKQEDLVLAGPKLTEAKTSLLETQKAYQKLKFLGVMPVVSKYQQDGEAGLIAAVAGVEAGELFIQTILPYADVLGFTGEDSTQSGTVEERIAKILETLDKVSPQLDTIGQKLTVVDTELQKINPSDYPETFQGKEIRGQLAKVELLVTDARKALTDAQPLVRVLPSIMGYPDTKKYLVLFQNDGELRPTGGFMSAFAVLKLEKGKITSEKSDDIYDLDNKFSKTIQPPAPFNKYLNEKRWFLRNMNFSPDYKGSMDTFKEHYDSLKGEEKVDGIIAIDTQVLERVVEITGPLQVPEWGTFTTENDARCNLSQIICELEHIIDRPLATVVTDRKATILGPMMKALLERSMGGGKEQLAKLIPLAFELMEQKHVLVYFNEETQQQAAESFNIAGRIAEYDGDYLHVNNANLGGAKSNFYVDETVDQEVTLESDGSISKKVTLSYKHTEPGDNCNLEAGELCLSGILRSYFRVYVPKGSQLKNGRGSMVEITSGEDLGKTYFEGFYELRPQGQVKIEFEYTVPYNPSGEYSVLIQKQPGIKNSQHTLTVNGKSETFELKKDTEKKVSL